jgi:hypothetical protein
LIDSCLTIDRWKNLPWYFRMIGVKLFSERCIYSLKNKSYRLKKNSFQKSVCGGNYCRVRSPNYD